MIMAISTRPSIHGAQCGTYGTEYSISACRPPGRAVAEILAATTRCRPGRRSGTIAPTGGHGRPASGGAEGIRTPDPLDANEVRYRTAPQPLITGSGPARRPSIRRISRGCSAARRVAVSSPGAAALGLQLLGVQPGQVDGVHAVQLDVVVVDAHDRFRRLARSGRLRGRVVAGRAAGRGAHLAVLAAGPVVQGLAAQEPGVAGEAEQERRGQQPQQRRPSPGRAGRTRCCRRPG